MFFWDVTVICAAVQVHVWACYPHTCSRHALCSQELSGPTGTAGRKSVLDTPWAVMNAQLSTTPQKQKHLRRPSFKTRGISSCAMKPTLGGNQPTVYAQRWPTLVTSQETSIKGLKKSLLISWAAISTRCLDTGCYCYPDLSQPARRGTHTVCVHGISQTNTCHCPWKTKQDSDQRFLPQSSYLPDARESLYNIPENTAGCKLVLNKCNEKKECWFPNACFWRMLH